MTILNFIGEFLWNLLGQFNYVCDVICVTLMLIMETFAAWFGLVPGTIIFVFVFVGGGIFALFCVWELMRHVLTYVKHFLPVVADCIYSIPERLLDVVCYLVAVAMHNSTVRNQVRHSILREEQRRKARSKREFKMYRIR